MSSSKRPFYDRIEEFTIVLFFSIMVIVTAFTVFSRYFFAFTFSWAEQLTRICFVWITFAGISLAAGKSMHLKVSAFTLLLSKKWTERVLFFGDFIAVIFGFFMSYKIFTLVLTIAAKNQTFPSMTWMPVWIMYIPGVFGMLGFSIRLIQTSLWSTIKCRIANNKNTSIANS